MQHLTTGDSAPNFRLITPDGDTVTRNDLLANADTTLLVFLRHLG